MFLLSSCGVPNLKVNCLASNPLSEYIMCKSKVGIL